MPYRRPAQPQHQGRLDGALCSGRTHALYNLIQPKPAFDALSDFAYVAVLGGAPVVFAVAPTMPRTLKTVLIAAKFNPDKYNYGSLGSLLLHHQAGRAAALAFVRAEQAKWKPIIATLGNLAAG